MEAEDLEQVFKLIRSLCSTFQPHKDAELSSQFAEKWKSWTNLLQEQPNTLSEA